jgi:dolichyl-phosphate-mannose--protein O-mannosyl transferase
MLAHEQDNNMAQPPLGKILIASSMKICWAFENQFLGGHDNEMSCVAWRAGSIVFGTAGVLMLFFLARGMFGMTAGSIAMFLMSIDFLHLVMSRVAMLDIYLTFFSTLAIYAAWEYMQDEGGARRWLLPLFGALACATAVKWSGLFTAASLLIAVVVLNRHPRDIQTRLKRESLHALAGLCVVVVVYGLCYLPNLSLHNSVSQLVQSVGLQQSRMFTIRFGNREHHRGFGLEQRYLSWWWQWPTLVRPVWFQFARLPHPQFFSIYQWMGGNKASVGDLYGPRVPTAFTVGPVDDPASELPLDKGWVLGIIAMGSPWVWWSFLLLLLALLGWALKHHERLPSVVGQPEGKAVAFLVIVYLGQLLIWIPVKGFLYYMVYEVPVMCLLLAWALQRLAQRPHGRWMVGGWLAIAFMFFVLYYPLLISYPIPMPYFWKLMWLPRLWI